MKTMLRIFMVIGVCLPMLLGLVKNSAIAQNGLSASPELYFVPDVESQFQALPERGAALGFGIGDSPDPSSSNHYQGIVRSHGAGTPYFFLTRNGGDDPANLLVVEMGSRPTHGERIRSNRLEKGTDTDDTAPNDNDLVKKYFLFDGVNGLPAYKHAGGMQLVGDILAVPLEDPLPGESRHNLIVFLDVSDPDSPTVPSVLNDFSVDSYNALTGLVALTITRNYNYLLLTAGGDNDSLWLFQSTSMDFNDPGFAWNFLDEWTEDDDEQYLGKDWPSDMCAWNDWDCDHPHQALNFVRKANIDDTLYLIGTRNKGGGGFGAGLDEDYFDLYKVEWCNVDRSVCQNDPGPSLQFTLRHVQTKDIVAKSTSDGADLCNFAASGGVYVSPTGELIIYGTEHDNDGPNDTNGVGTIKAGEWRHSDMARAGSPTFLPTAIAEGPFEVPEGGTIILKGKGEPPITKAWIELFADPDMTDRSIIIDYDDWYKEDFTDFKEIDQVPASLIKGFSDTASSWRWFAPISCNIRVNDDDFEDSNFPGKHTKSLLGNGLVNSAANLKDVQNDDDNGDMDDELTSMQFFENDPGSNSDTDCDTYYNAPIDVFWDLDRDGAYETLDEMPVFSAEGLDGPDVVTVGLMATHPVDGTSGTAEVPITITNVPPQIDSFGIFDFWGMEIGVDIPVALSWINLEGIGLFSDPGIPDTHTTTIDWGDGTFDDLGDCVSPVSANHVYTEPGDYHIILNVTDDDGGVGMATAQIEVVGPSDAIQIVIDMLRPHASSPRITIAIHKLLDSLHLLEKYNLNAALEQIAIALRQIEEAEAADPNLDTVSSKHLLALAVKSLTMQAIAETEQIIDKPNEQRKLEKAEKLVEEGDALLKDGDYVGSVDLYQRALREIQAFSHDKTVQIPPIDFDTEVDTDTGTVSLTIADPDPNDADFVDIIVFWGDRYRTEYTGILPTTIDHVYNRTGTSYHIRVKAMLTDGGKFNYTFMSDENLTVSIP